MPPADRNWMQDPSFDDESMAGFERRLARARPSSRAQYLRAKGASLLEVDDPQATRVAVGLLTRVVDEYDHFLEVPWSHELLAGAFIRLGDLEMAEHHLRRCIASADDRRNGTTGATELTLAEVLLRQGRVEEAGSALLAQDRGRLVWRSLQYRYAVAAARHEELTRGSPALWAKQALEIAADKTPQLNRLPDLGRVQTDRATLREMKRLAKRT